MKKLFILILSIIWTTAALGQVTTGFHRTNQLLARGSSGTYAQVVPNASVHVTSEATGLLATIYRDPLLTSQIVSGTVTTDAHGNYDYYIPLNYCVDEAVSSPGQGSYTTKNICLNGGLTATAVTAGSYGSSTAIPSITVNAEGQLTAASTNAVVAPASTLTGTTLASNVVSSSLTSVGSLTSLTVSGALTAATSSSNAITGTSSTGYGLEASSTSSVGGYFSSVGGTAGYFSNAGTLTATEYSPTLDVERSSTLGSYLSEGALIQANDSSGSTGDLLTLEESSTSVFYVDKTGNMVMSGQIKFQSTSKPTASSGTLTGTYNGGYVSGLSAATSLTLTFSTAFWSTWVSCTATPSVSLATAPYVSSNSYSAVTFTFPSLTGTLYYHCDGN